MTNGRIRHRQGPVRLVRGVPYSNRESTLSLLPGAAVGKWLAENADVLRGTLLDLGAGNQPFRPWYSPLVERVVAVDVAPAPGLSVLALAAPLPFLDSTFDCILCTSVLEHVEDAEASIAEITRVLKPGGRLLITVPFLYPTHEAPFDFWRVTHYGLASVLQRHGLQVDGVSAQGGPFLLLSHYTILSITRALSRFAQMAGPLGRLIDNRIVNAIFAAPQELCRSWVRTRLGPLSRMASLGYMASASKPDQCRGAEREEHP